MIQLPSGFDVSVLFSDFFGIAAPVISVIFLIVAYKYIKRSIA